MTMLINIFEASATRQDGTKPLARISISKPAEASPLSAMLKVLIRR